MKKDLLMWDETLFRDPEVFEIDYVPEQFNYRDDQIKELAFQIRPALRGGRPLNTVCRGLPGTGKTTCVKKLFEEISTTTKKVLPVYINCQIDNTKFAIFSQIYRKLTGHLPPPSGTSFKTIFDAIARMIMKDEIVLLICLDDANYLLYENEINNVLYPLLRSYESFEGTRIGVILIIVRYGRRPLTCPLMPAYRPCSARLTSISHHIRKRKSARSSASGLCRGSTRGSSVPKWSTWLLPRH